MTLWYIINNTGLGIWYRTRKIKEVSFIEKIWRDYKVQRLVSSYHIWKHVSCYSFITSQDLTRFFFLGGMRLTARAQWALIMLIIYAALRSRTSNSPTCAWHSGDDTVQSKGLEGSNSAALSSEAAPLWWHVSTLPGELGITLRPKPDKVSRSGLSGTLLWPESLELG